MCHISGLPVVCVTLMGVTDQTSSPRTSTDGFGLPTRPGWHPLTAGAPSTTGQPPEGEEQNTLRKHGGKYLSWWKYFRFSPSPKPQPDNREQTQLGGESESCMAVLNNFYGDGNWWSQTGDIFSWIVFQESSGTMWPVTMRSPSSARMSRVILPSRDKPSLISGSLKWREH